jgi:hypothetical protein
MPRHDYFRVTGDISKTQYDMAIKWYNSLVALGHQVFIEQTMSTHGDPHLVYRVWRFGEGAAERDNMERCQGTVVKATSKRIIAMFNGC